MPGRFIVPVINVRDFGVSSEIIVRVPESFQAQPGQFVHVACKAGGLILRRPYSINNLDDTYMSLLVKEVGSGSAWLRGREPGNCIDFLGPLGRGFALGGNAGYALVAGGMGIAPLRFAAIRLRELGLGALVLWGMESGEEYHELPDLLAEEMDLRLATLDGSAGDTGSVVELFQSLSSREFAGICACGPKGMLLGLAETIAKHEGDMLQVSLEEHMACGVGACKGCAVPAFSPAGGYLTVCKDGPVFYGSELDWPRVRESI